jgi:predicted CXXCH cytochrome family protein
LCMSSCHSSNELGRSHPRGSDTRDVVTGQELTCVLACHSNHSATQPKLLQEDCEALCARCHPDKY